MSLIHWFGDRRRFHICMRTQRSFYFGHLVNWEKLLPNKIYPNRYFHFEFHLIGQFNTRDMFIGDDFYTILLPFNFWIEKLKFNIFTSSKCFAHILTFKSCTQFFCHPHHTLRFLSNRVIERLETRVLSHRIGYSRYVDVSLEIHTENLRNLSMLTNL